MIGATYFIECVESRKGPNAELEPLRARKNLLHHLGNIVARTGASGGIRCRQ